MEFEPFVLPISATERNAIELNIEQFAPQSSTKPELHKRIQCLKSRISFDFLPGLSNAEFNLKQPVFEPNHDQIDDCNIKDNTGIISSHTLNTVLIIASNPCYRTYGGYCL